MKTLDPGRFTLRKKSVPTSQKTGWVPRAGLDGCEETPQYETVETVWEKWVLFLMLRHPEKIPAPLMEIDPIHFVHNLTANPWLHHRLIDSRVTENR
jgi:hypothetical protein